MDIKINAPYITFRGRNNSYSYGFTKNKDVFMFDSDDIELVQQHKWCKNYATNCIQSTYHNKTIYLHRLVMGQTETISGKHIDHINHNRTDNRKSNLRVCGVQENHYNQPKRKSNTSGIIGVSFNQHRKVYYAKIGVNGEKIFLGTFQNIEDAIKARLKAEKKYYGEFAPQKDLFKKYEIA